MIKRSVTHSLARALFAIVMLSVISSGLALLTLSGSLRDAEAVNLAGSLRMQIYRLSWDASHQSLLYSQHAHDFQLTLHAPALTALDRFYVPANVRQRYRALLMMPPGLQQSLISTQQQVAERVAQIDQFVLALQHWAELKVRLAAMTSLLGFIAIALLILAILRHIRRNVVGPLQQLVNASEAIEQTHFHLPPLSTHLPNELGVLARAFTRMSGELEKSFGAMALNLEQKNRDLMQANRRLRLLYACSQQLSHSVKGQPVFQQTLKRIARHEKLTCIEFSTPAFGTLSIGKANDQLPWHTQPLSVHYPEQPPAGELRWQAVKSEPALMKSIAALLAHALELWQAQQQAQSLLLLEERTTIASELHDSLAQSLTFLRIQLVRLKRHLAADETAALDIVAEFEQALQSANRQLRELLTTFRLTIEPAGLARALDQIISPLRPQSTANIRVDCTFVHQLAAQQQVHVLQIVREALLNAIRHAHASEISVQVQYHPDSGLTITIRDNGTGIRSLEEPDGHYGLSIMHERTARLNGRLHIAHHPEGGTSVSLYFKPVTDVFSHRE